MTTFDEVRSFIGRDADLSQLNELQELITHAKRGRAFSIAPGTRAKLVNIRPKYLEGMTGTVRGIRNDRLIFEPDVPQVRFGNPMRVPANAVVPI